MFQREEIDANSPDDFGSHPLQYVSLIDDFFCIKVLLEHADIHVNLKIHEDCSSLHTPVHNGRTECIRLLFNHRDINVNIVEKTGDTQK